MPMMLIRPLLLLLLALLASLVWHARQLQVGEAAALRSTVWICALVCLANGPLYGVGLGEAFLVLFAALLATQAPRWPSPSRANS